MRDKFSILRVFTYFSKKERSCEYNIFDICNCNWNYKSASSSMNGGMEFENHNKEYGNFSFICNC